MTPKYQMWLVQNMNDTLFALYKKTGMAVRL